MTIAHPFDQVSGLALVHHAVQPADVRGSAPGLIHHAVLVPVAEHDVFQRLVQSAGEVLHLLVCQDAVKLHRDPGLHLCAVILLQQGRERREALGVSGGHGAGSGGQRLHGLQAATRAGAGGEEDGVDHQRDGVAAAADLRSDRIHQVGHIVSHHIDDAAPTHGSDLHGGAGVGA